MLLLALLLYSSSFSMATAYSTPFTAMRALPVSISTQIRPGPTKFCALPLTIKRKIMTTHDAILEACPVPQCASISMPADPNFDWGEDVTTKTLEKYSGIPFVPMTVAATFLDSAVCLATDVTDVGECMALASSTDKHQDVFRFGINQLQFALDNCATHHVCSLFDLFIGKIIPAPHLGVKGINGVARAAGIGTIQFMIRNSLGKEEQITLHNVIYLPQAPKNLISITKWSSDLKDDCGIFSRGTYSIFMWGNDANKKLIHHPPNCKIPLMPANENDTDDFSAFLAEHPPGLKTMFVYLQEAPYICSQILTKKTSTPTKL